MSTRSAFGFGTPLSIIPVVGRVSEFRRLYPHRAMTAQINDTCFHRKIDFSVAGTSGSGLFEPATIGIQPVSMSTACWRGYVAHYSILDGELFLTSLQIGLAPDDSIRARAGKGPELFGVLPTADRFSGFSYEGFQSRAAFTGGLLLADGFVRELYVHMGFHPAWKYKTVREVIFEAGHVTADFDRSAEMADARTKFLEENQRSDGRFDEPKRGDIEAWIGKCFSREY